MYDNFLKAQGALTIFGKNRYSEEYKKFYTSGYKCSQCGKILYNILQGVTFKVCSNDGAKKAECPNCNYRWNIYDESNPTRPNKLEVVAIIETHRSEEILGTEQRLIDNSQSTSKTTRKFTVSREWSKISSIQYENTQTNDTELQLGLKFSEIEIANIKVISQESLKKKYNISEVTKENYTEEVQVEALESRKLNLIFRWKRIWQNGFIKLRSQDNTELNIPFKVVVGVTFDQFSSVLILRIFGR